MLFDCLDFNNCPFINLLKFSSQKWYFGELLTLIICNRAQVVGWPPIRSFRKNTMASNLAKNNDDAEGKQGSGCLYVKVSMDGAPYLRKVDLKMYNNYMELSMALEKMFSCFTIGTVLFLFHSISCKAGMHMLTEL